MVKGSASAKEAAIIDAIEKRKGPVGKGHNNAHRSSNILEWLREKEHPRASS